MWRIRLYAFMTVSVFGLLYIFTAAMVLIILPFIFLRIDRAVRGLLGFWARSVFPIIGKKLHIQGKENIKRGGKYILIANHSSLFDIMAIMSFFPGISWFGHERLLKIPLFRQVLKATNYVPMRPANIKNTKQMIDQLISKSEGHTIAIFPEGTRTLDGKLSEFYRGFIHILRNSDIDILPVTLNGFYLLKPKNRFYIDFNSKIDVIIHEPIDRVLLINKDDKEIISIVKNLIEASIIQ